MMSLPKSHLRLRASRWRAVVQTGLVAALVVFVGWPQFAPMPSLTLWYGLGGTEVFADDGRVDAASNVVSRGDALDDRDNRRAGSGLADESEAFAGDNPFVAVPVDLGDELPLGLADTGAETNAIVGRARTVTGEPVRYARLVLRNLSTGLVEARMTADQEGRFRFLDVIPTGYVVELVGADGTIIAASELVTVEDGTLRQASIRVASSSTQRAIFGSTVLTPTAPATIARAAEQSVRTVTQPPATNSPQF